MRRNERKQLCYDKAAKKTEAIKNNKMLLTIMKMNKNIGTNKKKLKQRAAKTLIRRKEICMS